MSVTPSQPTVTIGISAFNEARTIGLLLADLAKQKTSTFNLKKVIVISDGSNDQTVQKARKAKLGKLKVIDHRQRRGLAARLNELCHMATTDILVIFNADIRITDRHCLEALVQPLIETAADLSSCQHRAMPGKTWLEKSLSLSMELKNRIFAQINQGQNIYTCHGTARAFSRRLYSSIHFPHSVGEDGYSYLYTIQQRYKYVYVPNTHVWYREPSSFKDYQTQVARFQQSQTQFNQEFASGFLHKNYHIPSQQLLMLLGKSLLEKPLLVITYALVSAVTRLITTKRKPESTTWTIATSSKQTSF